ncbi:MAG: hypothetical protein QNK03_25845 [Myxococcota bacterium]|nr:hypothetical protein [Myxococcota bacterium]
MPEAEQREFRYVDIERFEAIDAKSFQEQKPFPWINPRGLIRDEAWRELERNLPPLEMMEQIFGKERVAGQQPHDRYSLEYKGQPDVPKPWRDFIDELCSDRYRRALCKLLGVRNAEFRFHWHYTPAGRSVSPHIDAAREYGSHIFYFNPEGWDLSWGGETLILDDGGRHPRKSAPSFEDFVQATPAECDGNVSMLFAGRRGGWHGVRALTCPEGWMRRVFIMVINPTNLFWKVRDRVIGKEIQRY